MFTNFTDYMWYLLTTPFKKVKKSINQFYIWCKVSGRLWDKCNEALMIATAQTSLMTCDDILLPEYGRDRTMLRLDGETNNAYRERLMAKTEISEMAGTKEGILYALSLLGYEKSTIEPYYIRDDTRWAEFIIYLRGSSPTITDIDIINAEVMKVKPARSMPIYESEDYNELQFQSEEFTFDYEFPRCGVLVCGTYPESGGTE